VTERENKTFEITGLPSLEDKTSLKDSVKKFLPETVAYEIHDFEYADSEYQQIKGKKFQVLLVVSNPDVLPVLSLAEGTSVKRNRIYVRHNSSSREAEHSEVQELIRKRLERSRQTPRSRELQEQLSQLEALYERKPPEIMSNFFQALSAPKAEFYRFVDRMITKKQEIIEKLLDS